MTKKVLTGNRGAVSILAAAFTLASVMACTPQEPPKAGDVLADGTIYVGDNLAETPSDRPGFYKWAGDDLAATLADAPGFYTWEEARHYCKDLTANGRDDWTLPTLSELSHLYESKNRGAFDGTFNESGPNHADFLYWSSSESQDIAWVYSFKSEGNVNWIQKDDHKLSVRCVRGIAP